MVLHWSAFIAIMGYIRLDSKSCCERSVSGLFNNGSQSSPFLPLEPSLKLIWKTIVSELNGIGKTK